MIIILFFGLLLHLVYLDCIALIKCNILRIYLFRNSTFSTAEIPRPNVLRQNYPSQYI